MPETFVEIVGDKELITFLRKGIVKQGNTIIAPKSMTKPHKVEEFETKYGKLELLLDKDNLVEGMRFSGKLPKNFDELLIIWDSRASKLVAFSGIKKSNRSKEYTPLL